MHLGFLGNAHLTKFSLLIWYCIKHLFSFLKAIFKFHWIGEFHAATPTLANWLLGMIFYIVLFSITAFMSLRFSEAVRKRIDPYYTSVMVVLGSFFVFWPIFIYFTN